MCGQLEILPFAEPDEAKEVWEDVPSPVINQFIREGGVRRHDINYYARAIGIPPVERRQDVKDVKGDVYHSLRSTNSSGKETERRVQHVNKAMNHETS